MAPLIGLTTYNGQNEYGRPIAAQAHKYILALTEAGAAPVLIPSGLNAEAIPSLLARLDGLLLPGGGDVAIERFDGQAHPCVDGVDPQRDELELALLKAVAQSGLPFLGICRGCQVVNVALGGTLYTDIQDQFPDALKHDYDSGSQRELLAHPVAVDQGSRLAAITGETCLEVNSLHHQGLKQLAPGLQVVARSPDGLVEAVELAGHPFGLAVQWHPEWLTGQPAMQRLFRAFVAAAVGG